MKNLRGDSPQPENNDDCRVLAPFVMTLFDGEADEFEARRARAHLLVCQTCARRWLDWNRSRDLLSAAPVPAPPPQLLWRVLMACRLAQAPHRAKPGAALPADFSTQIFARTTRALSTAAPRRFSSPLRLQALAVPALAMWMLILQRDAWLPAPVAPPVSTSDAALTRPPLARTQNAPRPQTATSGRVGTAVRVAASPLFPKPAPPAQSRAYSDARTEQNRPLTRSRRANQTAILTAASPNSFAPTPRAPRAINVRLEADAQPALLFTAFETPKTRRAASVVRVPRRSSGLRMAALSNQKPAQNLRTARWKSTPLLSLHREVNSGNRAPRPASGGAGRTSAPQSLRVSLPSARAPQPVLLLAENFDSDDERIEEARSVVDDFRATLGPDEGTNAETFPGDEDGAG